MKIPSNYEKAIAWIDAQNIKSNTELDLGAGIFINDLSLCLQTNRERLIHCVGWLQKLSYLKVKIIKDKLNQK